MDPFRNVDEEDEGEETRGLGVVRDVDIVRRGRLFTIFIMSRIIVL